MLKQSFTCLVHPEFRSVECKKGRSLEKFGEDCMSCMKQILQFLLLETSVAGKLALSTDSLCHITELKTLIFHLELLMGTQGQNQQVNTLLSLLGQFIACKGYVQCTIRSSISNQQRAGSLEAIYRAYNVLASPISMRRRTFACASLPFTDRIELKGISQLCHPTPFILLMWDLLQWHRKGKSSWLKSKSFYCGWILAQLNCLRKLEA